MDINSYSYAPYMLDEPHDDDQDINICVDCAGLIDGLCEYKKSNCTFTGISQSEPGNRQERRPPHDVQTP